jgi:hypothetical protein
MTLEELYQKCKGMKVDDQRIFTLNTNPTLEAIERVKDRLVKTRTDVIFDIQWAGKRVQVTCMWLKY